MKILVFGSGGFVGKHLINYLNTQDNVLIAVDRSSHPLDENFKFKNHLSKIISGDISSKETLDLIENVVEVDYVYFLVANPKMTQLSNAINESLGLLNNVFDHLIQNKFKGTFCYFSSSAVYGEGLQNGQQLKEDQILNPNSPYGLSKVMGETLTKYKANTNNFRFQIVRPFNLIGPGQPASFFISSLIQQLVRIKLGLNEPVIKLGDLSASRDFVDVRDLIKALQFLMKTGKSGETYNISSGRSWILEEVTKKAVKLIVNQVQIHQQAFDANPIKYQEGSCEKISNETNWKPEISLEKSLADMMDYWLSYEGKNL